MRLRRRPLTTTRTTRRKPRPNNGLARLLQSCLEIATACSSRREEADSYSTLAHPPPHVGSYSGQERTRLERGAIVVQASGSFPRARELRAYFPPQSRTGASS